MRNLFMAVVLAAVPAVVYGIDDIVLPLHDGRVVLKNIRFIEKSYSHTVPVLSFVLVNETSSSWRFITLRFEMSGSCNDGPKQWTEEIGLPLAWRSDGRFEKPFRKLIIPLVGKVDGCHTETIKAAVTSSEAENAGSGATNDNRHELPAVLREMWDANERKRASEEEQERRNADERLNRDAANVERRKRLAVEQGKKQAEMNARKAQEKAQEEARAAEERRRVRAACASIYTMTANKKFVDLTVKEEQQVRACQALALYPPQ